MEKERLEKLANRFRFNDYETIVCYTKQEARAALLEICKGKNVGVGTPALWKIYAPLMI